jgi:hypothetical protein
MKGRTTRRAGGGGGGSRDSGRGSGVGRSGKGRADSSFMKSPPLVPSTLPRHAAVGGGVGAIVASPPTSLAPPQPTVLATPLPTPPPAPVIQITYETVPVGPKIVIVNHSAVVDDSELAPAAAAFNRQANEHFALPPPLGYGIGASIRVETPDLPPQPDEWVLELIDQLPEPDALGYHTQTDAGLPHMQISPLLDQQDGVPWTSTASHEILEALVDPNLARGVFCANGKWAALEICDGVEADRYQIDGITVSNFVLPGYFEPMKNPPKLDYLGLVKFPLETRPGGYNQFWDPQTGWSMVEAERRAGRQRMHGRTGRRRLVGMPFSQESAASSLPSSKKTTAKKKG